MCIKLEIMEARLSLILHLHASFLVRKILIVPGPICSGGRAWSILLPSSVFFSEIYREWILNPLNRIWWNSIVISAFQINFHNSISCHGVPPTCGLSKKAYLLMRGGKNTSQDCGTYRWLGKISIHDISGKKRSRGQKFSNSFLVLRGCDLRPLSPTENSHFEGANQSSAQGATNVKPALCTWPGGAGIGEGLKDFRSFTPVCTLAVQVL